MLRTHLSLISPPIIIYADLRSFKTNKYEQEKGISVVISKKKKKQVLIICKSYLKERMIIEFVYTWLGLWLLYIALSYFSRNYLIESLNKRVVLVTGCDTGFGNYICRKLDSMGVHVIATCLLHKSTEELQQRLSKKCQVYVMDVTKKEEISQILEKVENYMKENKQLMFWGIVNNAGIVDYCAFELESSSMFEKVVEVNLLGCVNVTRFFLPLVRANTVRPQKKSTGSTKMWSRPFCKLVQNYFWNCGGAGRVVNIASVAGRIAAPYLESYHCSKCSTVEPSFTRTPLLTNACDLNACGTKFDLIVKDNPKLSQSYDKSKWLSVSKNNDSLMQTYIASDNIDQVYQCVFHALFDKYPSKSYYPNWQALFLGYAHKWIPSILLDWVVALIFDTDILYTN
ncbi:hypothetical protein RFI_27607 [Reticulomyxa filosa]|uniref:Uncharacterized protein n=1 Tax=Reticulomyxa filosa TaxID=46433 RepID=X6M771_RETFI|nr:hypothetical protein RFI_27607 [Reticulomyxa filosa]|eukprot:ETO09774.1 hypothetical protein RFI_27607 [Reticulomyxa filosa]